MKSENEKKFLIGKDDGHIRKIALIDGAKKEFYPNLSKILPIVEQTGNEERFRGFYATTPTIYRYLDNFKNIQWEPFVRYQGCLYELHQCSNPDIVVYCFSMKMNDYQNSSSAGKFIKELMDVFGSHKK